MSESDFLFALELSDEASFDKMLTDIAAAVCLHLGLGRPAVDALVAEIRQALRAGGAQRRCEVRFLVRGGELEIVVTHQGAPEWRTRRALP